LLKCFILFLNVAQSSWSLTIQLERLQVEFTVTERKLPKLVSFTLRVDSSLGESLRLPEEASVQLCSEALEAGAAGSTAEACLRMLPKLEALAAASVQGQVSLAACLDSDHF
jgi:hypothetical protein